MLTAPAGLARKRSGRLLRHLSGVEPRRLLTLTVHAVRVAGDGNCVESTLPTVTCARPLPYLAHADAYDLYDPAETTALRLAGPYRALLCVGYAVRRAPLRCGSRVGGRTAACRVPAAGPQG